MSDPTFADLRFDADGLVPVVIQDADTSAVLMMAFMNREALEATRQTGRVHFWSRSRTKLWRKGESSGHEQIVDEIFVNCDLNSLLITVRQIGATCHDGYPTCYYRRVEPNGTLTIVRDRWFDPADVYGDGLAAATQRWFGAYEYLRDHDLAAESSTSRRLRDPGASMVARVADELTELAGVLDGSHVHENREADALLEGSQCLYWLACVCVQAGVAWETWRPDRALDSGSDALPVAMAARLLRAEATRWSTLPEQDLPAATHAAAALVAQAVRAIGLEPRSLIDRDEQDLRSKPYLGAYFAR